MALVITRIELHGLPETAAAYALLHRLMEGAGFVRTILSTRGLRYRLPHATYSSEIYPTVQAANAAANGVAAGVPTTEGHGVVSSGEAVWFDGLREV